MEEDPYVQNHSLIRPRRLLSLLAALSMATTMLMVAPTTAEAHDTSCASQPTATGFLASVMSAVNVFASFLDTTEAECVAKGGNVEILADGGFTMPIQSAKGDGRTDGAPCEDGLSAGVFACDGIDMMSHVSMNELRLFQGTNSSKRLAVGLNDIWGWTDSETGKEYALVGSDVGTVFVDVSNATAPKALGILPTASTLGNAGWRDIKVYEDHAFVVSEHFEHGVQVFDLTRLRDHKGNYKTYDMDAHYTEMGAAHNIAINEDTGFAYALGSSYGAPIKITVGGETYSSGNAGFGVPVPAGGVDDATLSTVGGTACNGETLPDLSGTVVLIDRGACRFDEKTTNAQAAGAEGVIIVNNQDTGPIGLGGDPSLPIDIFAVSLSKEDGAAIRAQLPTTADIASAPPAICGDGLHMIDISDPKNPAFAGCEFETGYVHDTQCVIYEGPDTEHHGKEICFNSNGIGFGANAPNFFSIVDVSDKSAPETISIVDYAGSAYSHQGWLTEDQGHFLFGDEGDELTFGVGTSTRVWDVTDLENPFVASTFESTTEAIDHNLYTKDGLAYASNYEAGLRVYDASAPAEGLSEVAFFDMYPEGDAATFDGGTWSNYPYFESGLIVVSSVDRGLFVLKMQD